MTTSVKKDAPKAEEKAVVKPSEVKAVETKAVEAKTPAVKKASKVKAEKAPKEKKAAAPKAAKAEKAPKAEKAADTKVKLVVEHHGRQVAQEDMVAAVKRAWVGAGKKAADLKTLELYVKPEDGAVYYVINGENNGQVAF